MHLCYQFVYFLGENLLSLAQEDVSILNPANKAAIRFQQKHAWFKVILVPSCLHPSTAVKTIQWKDALHFLHIEIQIWKEETDEFYGPDHAFSPPICT